MMAQVWFVVGLYILGVLIGLMFAKHVPIPFIVATGILWGSLAYSLLAFVTLVLDVYHPLVMLIVLGLLGVFLIIQNIRQGAFNLDRQALTWLVGVFCVFFLAAFVLERHNISKAAGLDPQSQILVGRSLAREGFAAWNSQQLSSWGFLLVSIQSVSVFLGIDYIHIFQPLCGITFLLTFSTGLYYVLAEQINERRTVFLIVGACTLLLFSTYGIVLQMEFINTNLISAMYLFTAFIAFWMGLKRQKHSWLTIAMLALTGFTLARTEAPVFALIMMTLVLSVGKLSYRERLIFFLPYLSIFILRYLYMVLTAGTGSIILNSPRMLGVLGLLIVFTLLVLGSGIKFVETKILPRLHIVMITVLGAALATVIAVRPGPMLEAIRSFFLNLLFLISFWGVIWYFFLVQMILSGYQPSFEYERLFTVYILGFLLVLLAMAYFRVPYGYYWHDSSNRISTHIAPIILLYLAMKYSWGLFARPEPARILDQSDSSDCELSS
ncbi:MAG: hypothetical protein JXJ17_03440 [Anaerolineae bacterium]|nr:hypothetical protein [Anaerolineae bacterium]